MSIYITGDTHGDFQRFATKNFPQLKGMDRHYQPDKLTDFLETVRQRCRFGKWFCGHYHIHQIIDERFVIQWEQISKID